jgi:hypothetical protein
MITRKERQAGQRNNESPRPEFEQNVDSKEFDNFDSTNEPDEFRETKIMIHKINNEGENSINH